MNKIYVHPAREDWIVDRFVKEWNEDNFDISTNNPFEADVIWLLAGWCWQDIAQSNQLKNKKILTTIHHIVPEKFDDMALKTFIARDLITNAYHVYNEDTKAFISRFSDKPVHLINYWANQKIWRTTGTKLGLREKFNLPVDAYLIGSFQRDTEGIDLKSPKLEKGPDLFLGAIEHFRKRHQKLHVVLAGWRRQYVIAGLEKLKIPYTYFERPQQEIINELYQTLDLYPVTSRCEGGPQALIECGLLNVPVISRNVGIARQVLPLSAISDDIITAIPAIPCVEEMKLPGGYEKYRNLMGIL